tara:strand:- start:2606 stop:2938 length:333 start_codon:yes stop_codon:yes gene_type:complete
VNVNLYLQLKFHRLCLNQIQNQLPDYFVLEKQLEQQQQQQQRTPLHRLSVKNGLEKIAVNDLVQLSMANHAMVMVIVKMDLVFVIHFILVSRANYRLVQILVRTTVNVFW